MPWPQVRAGARPNRCIGRRRFMSNMECSLLPNLQTLTVGLTSVFRSHGSTSGKLTVLDRQPNIYGGTFLSEIVTCHFDDSRELQLLCKYGAAHNTTRGGRTSNVFGHKGGVPYDAVIYRHAQTPVKATIALLLRSACTVRYLTQGKGA